MAVVQHGVKSSPGDAVLLARWRAVPTAIIADVSKGTALIDPAIRPLRPPGQQPRLFGNAVTAWCEPPDFGAVLYALDLLKPGDVLVIAAAGNRDNAMLGEILGGQLRRRGASGVICDGALRDVAELASWPDLSVFTRFVTPRGPNGAERGVVNATVSFGGREISPGDLVIGDDDGLVCLSPEMLRPLIAPAETKLNLEDEWQASLKSGKTMAQTFALPPLTTAEGA